MGSSGLGIIAGSKALLYRKSGGWRLRRAFSWEQVFSGRGLYRRVPGSERRCWGLCCRPCSRRGCLQARVCWSGGLPINRYHCQSYRDLGRADCCLQTFWPWRARVLIFKNGDLSRSIQQLWFHLCAAARFFLILILPYRSKLDSR